jgi:hypothetical protein
VMMSSIGSLENQENRESFLTQLKLFGYGKSIPVQCLA